MLTVVAVYGTSNNDPQFYRNFQSNIEILEKSSWITGGDWNGPLNFNMDTINYLHENYEKSHKQIQLMIKQLNLIDTHKEFHPHM